MTTGSWRTLDPGADIPCNCLWRGACHGRRSPRDRAFVAGEEVRHAHSRSGGRHHCRAPLVAGCAGSAGATVAPAPRASCRAGRSTAAIAAEPTEWPLGSYEACDAGAPGAITLTVRDQEAEDGIGPVIDQLSREFEAANTSVDVVRQNETRGDLANSILGAITTAQGPDITQLEPGRAGVGEAVKAGLLLPLTDAYTRYGWGDRWAPRTLDRMRFADDGTGFGSGTLYGVPVTGELVGLMFNDEAGHAKRPAGPVPQTLDEDMEDYALIKGAGWTPILVGAADGEMLHVYGSILGSLVTPESLDSFVYGRDGGSFEYGGGGQGSRDAARHARPGLLRRWLRIDDERGGVWPFRQR